MTKAIIEKVTRKSGIKYKARVRCELSNKKRFEKSKTFDKKTSAQKWAKEFIKSLEIDGIPNEKTHSSILIGDLITLYLNDPFTSRDLGRSKRAVLQRLRSYDIALIDANRLSANHIVEHCKTRLQEPSKPLPQTVYHDVTYLRSVINVAGPMFGYSANLRAHEEAIPTLVTYGLIGRSDRRDRRPTQEELRKMEKGLEKRQNHRAAHIPLVDIFHISILTCMRLSEICRVTWNDLDMASSTLTIRDRKDPRIKKGNDSTIPLCEKALSIINKQKRTENEERIFPFKSTSIGAAWQRVCKEQQIYDLHYHDLRAEGACQLFESGLSIVEVSKITGHRDINILNNVYLRLGVETLHSQRNN
ncbi:MULTISPECIES: site-specific integrase [Vibrionaceae]|uniref:Site-specific integrase n=1 Tax=Photobacterium damselae TaxID=38293 RepID=A0ABD6WZ49_PHODM|nr:MULTISPECIES: site-specific integrase [Vibrionaceae]EGR0803794.1 site-specific integrase [Vibrio alginolyticus]MBM5027481.1 site-specific integrase [Vibrio parahaemolyticus]OBU38806.1 integrase [Photobacterium damselae]POB85419.1 site-specific integrase [Vibrio vulnificus]PSU15069.1 site-specific integrase [Photobacterium damselae]